MEDRLLQDKQRSKGIALLCNAEGIEHIRNGYYAKASQSFHRSLQAMQALLDMRAQGSQQADICQGNSASAYPDLQSYQGHICSVERPQEAGLPYPSDDLFLLFRWPLDVASDGMYSPEDAHEGAHMHLMSTVVLFNLALSLHLQGLREGHSELLSQALRLYVIGYSALNRPPLSTSPSSSRMSIVALVALTNNIGHIHAHFRRLTEAAACSEKISSYFALISSITSTGLGLCLSEREHQILFMNGCLFQKNNFSASPAA